MLPQSPLLSTPVLVNSVITLPLVSGAQPAVQVAPTLPVPAGSPRTDSRPSPVGLAGAVGTALALALMRHVVQPVILMDPDGRVTQVNGAGLALVPPQRGTPQGRFWWELWPHADRAELRAALAEAAAGEETTITLDCRRTLASAATLIPLEDDAGGVAKVLCVLRAR